MKTEKIVVGTDFSASAKVALETAIEIGRRTSAEIVLVRASRLAGVSAPSALSRRRWRSAVDATLANEAEKLALLCERYEGQGVALSTRLIEEVPARGLIQVADETGADLIVVGTHGHEGIDRIILGSVAQHVVRHSHTSVLVARPGPGSSLTRRILATTDFSPSSELAVTTASELVEPGGELELMHCVRLPPGLAAHWVDSSGAEATSLSDAVTIEAREQAADLMAEYEDRGFSVSFTLSTDAAKDAIAERARKGNFDLVVTGSHGRSGVKRWLIGSVAEATVQHAPCSVLVVRKPA